LVTGGTSAVTVAVIVGFATLPFGGHSRKAAATASAAYVQYTDPSARFTLDRPSSWSPQAAPSDVALVLRAAPGSEDSLLVRFVSLRKDVAGGDPAAVRKLTDPLVDGADTRVLLRRPISVNGVSGLYYLYTFGRSNGGGFGIHAHYFLFPNPRTMVVLVLQALPDTDFVKLAPTFDRLASSFRAGPAASATPAPP
jgi:hypothetical protein